ncbi:MAG: hypothetical protein HUJ61_08150 [Bacilli bacterium]|nr:hypothetical protein [Bacilli bacterium]
MNRHELFKLANDLANIFFEQQCKNVTSINEINKDIFKDVVDSTITKYNMNEDEQTFFIYQFSQLLSEKIENFSKIKKTKKHLWLIFFFLLGILILIILLAIVFKGA